jgi:tripartite-type tricarboxylate transporter receptor subunit TctC
MVADHHFARARQAMMRRLRSRAAAAAALLFCGALPLHAQGYPDRPVKIIVPTVAAGTVDLVTRVMANDLSQNYGNRFFIENRSGAGNTLGSRDVAHSDPDGYTLLMSSASGQVISPLIYKDPGYDPLASFAPIAPYAEGSVILVVNPSLPFHSVADLVAYAKANPAKLSYGSAGTGTVPHLTAELFKSAAGIAMVHVPYRGGALSIQDVIAGNLQLTFEASSPLLAHIGSGQLRALAVLSAKRIAELPDVPTIGEAGYPGVLTASWTGLFAPAGTGAAIVQKLNAAINASLQTAATKQALGRLGNAPKGGTPQDLTNLMVADIKKWTPIVKALNLEPQ